MNKKTLTALLWIVLFVVVIGFLGWYLFIAKKQRAIDTTLAGRGVASDIPTFGGGLGSLYENSVGSFSTASSTKTTTPNTPVTHAPQLWHLSDVPAAGVALFPSSGTGTSTVVAYFLERVSGNLFQANPETSEVTRVTNTLIPYTYTASWISTSTVVMQHVGEDGQLVNTVGTVAATSTEEYMTMDVAPLERDVVWALGNPWGETILTLLHTPTGLLGNVAPYPVVASPKRVWKSFVKHVRFVWVGPHTLLAFQSPAEGIDGSAYVVDTKTGVRRLLVSGVFGLSPSISEDGTSVLYSESSKGSLKTILRTPAKEFVLGIRTLGEKCVFAPGGHVTYCAVPTHLPTSPYPDAWYRGEIHSSDEWWQVDTNTGVVTRILSPEQDFGVRIDVLEPHIDPSGGYISFLDAVSGTPWLMRVEP